MKLKLAELMGMREILQKVANTTTNLKSAYRINKILKPIHEEMKKIEELRIEKIKTYDNKDEKGNYSVPQEKVAEFMKEYEEMLKEEIEINAMPLDLETLTDIKLTPIELGRIEKIIKE